MDPTPLQQIAAWANAAFSGPDAARTVTRVCTDTRALQPGDLFLALRGERFDGHRFVAQAAAAGAAAAVVDAAFAEEAPAGFALLRVEDTLWALQQIAAAYRASLPLRVLCLTGSTGKTSTKDFTAAVLGERFRVVKTEGNFNNHIGLPLTMLRASAADEIGIFEIGMNHPGEIAPLAALARPDAAIITNIGTAHIEFLGSRAGIAEEKGRLAEALPEGGVLFLNDRDEFSDAIAARTRARVVRSGIGRGAVSATLLASGMEGSRFRVHAGEESVEVVLPVPGLHMIENALLALAAGLAFGVPLEVAAHGLAATRLTHGRLERKARGGIDFLDDSYNANPDSMRAALRTLAVLPVKGARIAVLGRMGELGPESEHGHRTVGRDAADAGVDWLVAVGGEEAGQLADGARRGGLREVVHVADPAEAAALLAARAKPGDLVLLKGSRSARMERVFEHPAFQSPEEAL